MIRNFTDRMLLVLTLALIVASSPTASAQSATTIHLLFSADTEGRVTPYEDCCGAEPLGGISRRATLIDDARGRGNGPIVLDAGNAFFGTDSSASQGKVVADALSAMKYDVVNVSYRDIRKGSKATVSLCQDAAFRGVSANLRDSDSGELLFDPFVIVESGDRRVAVLGVTQRPAGIAILPHLKKQFAGMEIEKPSDALDRWLPQARKQAEIVVVLYYGSSLELANLRKQFADKIDVFLCGGISAAPPAANEKPQVATVRGKGIELTKVVIAGRDVKVDTVPIDDRWKPSQPVTNLLAEYLPEDQLLGTPLVAIPEQGDDSLDASYRHASPGATGIRLRWPGYRGAEPTEECPKGFPGGPALWRTSYGGRYFDLLKKLNIPDDGEFRVSGYSGPMSYKGHDDLPAAYWVYDPPHWYLWRQDRWNQWPYTWFAVDVESKEKTAGNRWNFLALPPGKYDINVQAWYGTEITVAKNVVVAAEHTTSVPLRSGLQVVTDYPYTSFSFHNMKGEQVGSCWSDMIGYLPAGEYRLKMNPKNANNEFLWGNVKINDGGISSVPIDSGVRRGEPLDRWPLNWHFHDQRTGKQVVSARGNFGRLMLPPATYDVLLTANADAPVRWGQVEVKAGLEAELRLDSGVDLKKPEDMPYYFAGYTVFDAATRERVAHFYGWGYSPLPPGKYFALGNVDERLGPETAEFVVREGDVTKLDLEMLGFSRVVFETPVAKKTIVASQSTHFTFTVVQGETAIETRSQAAEVLEANYEEWVPVDGEVTFRVGLRHAPDAARFDQDFDTPGRLVRGKTTTVPFDAEDLAKRYDMMLFDVDWGTEDPETLQHCVVIMMDEAGELLTAYRKAPAKGTRFLAEKGMLIRLQRHSDRVFIDDLPTQAALTIDFDERHKRLRPPTQQVLVDCVIESPTDGEIIDGDTVQLIGQAATERFAGATRIAIVLDVSASVSATSGADLDGDGVPESVIEAEIAAAKLLLEELDKIERQGPGTAFEVTILRFYDGADVMAPLTPLSDDSGLKTLRAALDRIGSEGSRGETAFSFGIDAAVKEFRAKEKPAPAVIVFLTDGQGQAPDAAARAGLAGVTLHTVGMGSTFRSALEESIVFPAYSPAKTPIGDLQFMSAVGAPGGTAWPVPNPQDILDVIAQLPIAEIPKSGVGEVRIENLTTKQVATKVELDEYGFFQADVPVDLIPDGKYESNQIQATAIARDGKSQDSDHVGVRGQLPWAELTITRAESDAAVAPVVEFVLDSSGSMQSQLDGMPKHVMARNVILGLLSDAPDTTSVGLRLFGHLGFRNGRRIMHYSGVSDPRLDTDSELVVPIALLDAKQRTYVTSRIKSAEPLGKTPLVHSLLQAKDDFPRDHDAPKLVILISDGKETCGGNILDVAAAYRNQRIECAIHVVGFDINDAISRHKLQRIAQYGGGKYYGAANAAELSGVLRSAVRNPGFVVLDRSGERAIERGTVNGTPVKLKAGNYLIRLAGDDGSQRQVQLSDRQKLGLTVSPDGQLSVAP